MKHTLRLLPLGLLVAAMVIAADPPEKKEPPKVSAAPQNVLEMAMADGSKVVLALAETTLRVQTKYGILEVQGSEIRRIDLGFRYPAGMEDKVKEAVEGLGSGSFRTRESSQADILRYGALAVPLVRGATKSADAEVAQRAAELLKKLEEKLPAEQFNAREFDMVYTSDFPIKGKILTTHVSGKTAYFGDAKVELAQVRKIRSTMFIADVEVAVDGIKYGQPNQEMWLETEVELSSGQVLDIKASGQVSMYPSGGATYMSGPNGTANGGRPGQFQSGALLGKIGDGKPFVVGERYSEAARQSGKLYLRINPGVWGYPTTGSYSVNISAGVNRGLLSEKSETPKPELKPDPKVPFPKIDGDKK